jgi:hypothetical protein
MTGPMAPTQGQVLFRGQRLTVQQNVEVGLEARRVPAGPRSGDEREEQPQ